MSAPLPRPMEEVPVRDLAELQARVLLWAREVEEHLRLSPSVETVVVSIDPATLPLSVLVQTQVVRGVVRLRTVDTSTGATKQATGIRWSTPKDDAAPGVVIEGLEGCTDGTVYELTLGVVGERV